MKKLEIEEKKQIIIENLLTDTIKFGKIFQEFESAQSDCDSCPMDTCGICLAKCVWPRITTEMIEIIVDWLLEQEK